MRVPLRIAVAVAIALAIFFAIPAQQPATIELDRNWLVQKLPPEEIARLESLLEQNPDDVATRLRLMCAYIAVADNERRARHLLWLIERHPEIPRLPSSLFVHAGEGPLQDVPSYQLVAELWKQQASIHPADPNVIANAAEFLRGYYYFRDDPFEAERWIRRARDISADRLAWTRQLAQNYAAAIAWGEQRSEAQKAFASHAREALRSSTDRELLWLTGDSLSHFAGPDAVKILSAELKKRAEDLGFQPPIRPMAPVNVPRASPQIALQPIHRVEPNYPAAAAQAKLSGVMRLHIWVAASGDVRRAEVITGHPLMRQPARDAVLQWKYPAQNVELELDVEVPFGPRP